MADAIKADDVAQATAIRQGEKDPGRKNTQRVAKALRSAQDRERVQAEVVEQTYRAIFEVVQEHREDVLAAVDETKEERRRDYRDAVTALEVARRDFWRMDDMRRWVNDMSRLYKEPERPLVARNLRLPNGTPPMFDVITQGMRDETDPPEPERTPSHYRTVTEAITSPGGTHIGNTYRTEAVYDDTTTEEARQAGPGPNIGGVPVYTGDDG